MTTVCHCVPAMCRRRDRLMGGEGAGTRLCNKLCASIAVFHLAAISESALLMAVETIKWGLFLPPPPPKKKKVGCAKAALRSAAGGLKQNIARSVPAFFFLQPFSSKNERPAGKLDEIRTPPLGAWGGLCCNALSGRLSAHDLWAL